MVFGFGSTQLIQLSRAEIQLGGSAHPVGGLVLTKQLNQASCWLAQADGAYSQELTQSVTAVQFPMASQACWHSVPLPVFVPVPG